MYRCCVQHYQVSFCQGQQRRGEGDAANLTCFRTLVAGMAGMQLAEARVRALPFRCRHTCLLQALQGPDGYTISGTLLMRSSPACAVLSMISS